MMVSNRSNERALARKGILSSKAASNVRRAMPVTDRCQPRSAFTRRVRPPPRGSSPCSRGGGAWPRSAAADRKSTRLNSSHSQISYAVFCLKKKRCAPRPGPTGGGWQKSYPREQRTLVRSPRCQGAELRSRNQRLDDTQRLGSGVGLHHWFVCRVAWWGGADSWHEADGPEAESGRQ